MKLIETIREARIGFQILSLSSPDSPRKAALKVVKARAAEKVKHVLRRFKRSQVRAVSTVLGPSAGAEFFWRAATVARRWGDVEQRLNRLAVTDPSAIENFTRVGFQYDTDPMVLLCMARNPHSGKYLGPLIAEADLSEGSPVAERIRVSLDYSAAFCAAAGLLLDDETAQRIGEAVLGRHPNLNLRFHQILDSVGVRPAHPPSNAALRGIPDSGMRKPCGHRLIVAESFADMAAIAQLFVGAGKVTVIGLNDTFGKADFAEFTTHLERAEVTVEHVRSRITRFSQRYLDIHEATRDASQQIAARLLALGGLLTESDRPAFELALADHLFFECLKMESVRELLASDEFDHIVIACPERKADGRFFQLLAGVDALRTDTRVEILSIARRIGDRATFTDGLETMLSPPPAAPSAPAWGPPHSKIAADLEHWAAQIAGRMKSFSGEERKNVLLVTANNPAYNAATAHYARTLARQQNVTIGFVGSNVKGLAAELKSDETGLKLKEFQFLPVHFPRVLINLEESMRRLLLDFAGEAGNPMMAHLIRIGAARITRDVLKPGIVYHKVMNAWFDRLARTDALPDLVVLSPVRIPRVAAFSAIARAHGVPSLALEAHGLNANYSRYINVDADFYGVISNYFRKQSDTGFRIPNERTFVVGSPRIVSPQKYNSHSARYAARKRIRKEFSVDSDAYEACISFFCQPSNWQHVELVWRNILSACKGLGIIVLLKPHPEETPSRVEAYLAVARNLGMANFVALVETDPKTVIQASDMVLTGYSAAAIDAAVLGVPVVCVTNGDTEYPVDQHEIIDGLLVRSDTELRMTLTALVEQPDQFLRKAEAFLAREPQFRDGPDENLNTLIEHILAMPADQAIRDGQSVPRSLFLKGPYKTFPV